MKKSIFLVIAFMAISASNVSAQIVWGGRIGLSRPTITATGKAEGTTVSMDIDGVFGLELGPVLYYTMKNNWYMNSGAMFSLKSFRMDDESVTKYYVDVPLYLGYRIPAGKISLYGQAGPFIGYMLAESAESAMKPLNAGLGAMFGINLKRFKIELGYQAGLLNLLDTNEVGDTGGTEVSARLSSVFLGVSYVF
jgi:hypothetical protein